MPVDPETLRQLGEGRLEELRVTAASHARASAVLSARPRRSGSLARRARWLVGGALISAGARVAGHDARGRGMRTC